jgi:hypothetical protein
MMPAGSAARDPRLRRGCSLPSASARRGRRARTRAAARHMRRVCGLRSEQRLSSSSASARTKTTSSGKCALRLLSRTRPRRPRAPRGRAGAGGGPRRPVSDACDPRLPDDRPPHRRGQALLAASRLRARGGSSRRTLGRRLVRRPPARAAGVRAVPRAAPDWKAAFQRSVTRVGLVACPPGRATALSLKSSSGISGVETPGRQRPSREEIGSEARAQRAQRL